MITKSKVPKIRFKGFNREWDNKKLSDIGSVAMNKRIFKNQTTEKGDIPFYKIGTFGAKADAFISRQLFEDYKLKYPYPQKGDLLISASGSIGRIVEYTGEDEYFQDSNIVWLKHENKIENIFLKQFYNIVKWNGLEGSTIQRLYNKNILDTEISFPRDKNEQTKIGNYFHQLDKLIEQKEKKYQKLKQFKKTMLNKMFPKNGADTPEIRFKGFSGKWEEKKLGEICQLITKGTTPLDKSSTGTINYIKVENINSSSGQINITTKITKEEHQNYLKRSQLQENDILFSIAGTLGRVTTISRDLLPANTNQALAIIRLNQCVLSYIVTYLKGNTVKHYIKQNPTVGAQPNLSLGQIENIELLLPKEQEQEQIGNYFQKLDKQIDLQLQEIEKLKNIKKASLDKMFI